MNIAVLKNINSWPEFTALLSRLSKKEKGDAFEELTLHYLRLNPTYATILETVWHHRNIPHEIRNELNLPDTDEGIDLVARTRDGNYWAIQCKYHEDENHSLTRRELATFTDLTFGVCKGFELALVCTSADRFSHKLALHGERIAYIAGDAWRELDSAFFARLHKSLSNRPVSIKPASPRPHQKEALKEAVQHFVKEGNERGKLIMPCGSGKSLTGWWLAEKLAARTVLIAVPSLSLVKQTLEVWARESVAHSRSIRWIAVCSDESVARDERNDAAVLVQDLGVRVHTDPHEIADWLKHPHDGMMVVFTTYQSGRAIAEASRTAAVTFDLGILDEAHKTVGKRGSLFDHLLHDENIEIRRRVFMTATERRYRGDSDNILSMDDPESYGETFHLLSFKSALECDPPILSDYKIVTVAVTLAEIASLVKANLLVRPDRGEWNDDLEAEMLASLVALRKAMQQFPIRHAVSFHSSIAKAKSFRDSQDTFTSNFPDYGQLDTFHVTGSTPTAVRKREIDAFARAERSLITNARCLTEGVDVPGIDCVLFADPKRSTVDIVQAVGRALRPAPDKDLGYVVIPVVVDDSGNPDATRFDSVLMVLRALATNDERIVEYFRTVSQGKQYSGSSPVEFTVPVGVQINADEFVQSIELKAWSRLAKLSWRPFEDAREYVHTLGLVNIKEWWRYIAGEFPALSSHPKDIPSRPDSAYKKQGWISWGDWFGSDFISYSKRKYLSFREAREIVRALKLENKEQWDEYLNSYNPSDGLPARPDYLYRDSGWIDWGDFLGTDFVHYSRRKYKTFEDAKKIVHSLGLRGSGEWRQFIKGDLPRIGILPDDIPAYPERYYKNKGWISWREWLGDESIHVKNNEYKPYVDAKAFVHTLGLTSSTDWSMYSKGLLVETKGLIPNDIPKRPEQYYKDTGWSGFGDWLGTGQPLRKLRRTVGGICSFPAARDFARSLGLLSGDEWRIYVNGDFPDKPELPQNISTRPDYTYKYKGWMGWQDWLGYKEVRCRIQKHFLPFEDAKTYVHAMNLASESEWRLFCAGNLTHSQKTLPKNIPKRPDNYYQGAGWKNWSDWLGNEYLPVTLREYMSFHDAKTYIAKLNYSLTESDWRAWIKGDIQELGEFPKELPRRPDYYYRNDGWNGWHNFFGGKTRISKLNKRDLASARRFAHGLFLKSKTEWESYIRGQFPDKPPLPDDMSSRPDYVYKNKGWISWPDWLGTEKQ